jgi:hypothetical protein
MKKSFLIPAGVVVAAVPLTMATAFPGPVTSPQPPRHGSCSYLRVPRQDRGRDVWVLEVKRARDGKRFEECVLVKVFHKPVHTQPIIVVGHKGHPAPMPSWTVSHKPTLPPVPPTPAHPTPTPTHPHGSKPPVPKPLKTFHETGSPVAFIPANLPSGQG